MATAAQTMHSVRICCLCAEYATFDAGINGWLLLMLGLIMPSYALRYVFFGTRWGSNSSFAMVNMLFTSLCPARILLPCPDSNPANCHLTYPKMFQQSADLANSSGPSTIPQPAANTRPHVQLSTAEANLAYNVARPSVWNKSQIWQQFSGCPFGHHSGVSITADAALNVFDSRGPAQHVTQDRANLHFPVLVPLWRIYVKERPLPIYLHTTFMTVAAILWPLQVLESDAATHLMYCAATQLLLACLYKLFVSQSTNGDTLQDSDTLRNGRLCTDLLVVLQLWKEFRQQNYVWHQRLGYVALAASALGSLSAAPYAVTYLLSAKIPETVSIKLLWIWFALLVAFGAHVMLLYHQHS